MILVKHPTETKINTTLIDMQRNGTNGMHFSLGSVTAFVNSLVELYHAICANFNFLSDTFFGGYDHLTVTEPPTVGAEINVSSKKPILFRMKQNAVNAFNAVLNKIELNYNSSYRDVSSNLTTVTSLTNWASQSNSYYSSAEALMNTKVSPLIGEFVQSGGITSDELYEVTSEASDNADEVIEEAVTRIVEEIEKTDVKEDDVASSFTGAKNSGKPSVYEALMRKAEEASERAKQAAKEEQAAKERAETARGKAEAAKQDAAKAAENADNVHDVVNLWLDLMNGATAEPGQVSAHYVDENGNIVTVVVGTNTAGDGKTSFSTYTVTVTNPVTGEQTTTMTSITHESGKPVTPSTVTHTSTTTMTNDGKGTVTTTETSTSRTGGVIGLITGTTTETTTTTVENHGVVVSETSEENTLSRAETSEKTSEIISESSHTASDTYTNAVNSVEGASARAEQAEAEAASAEEELAEAHTAAQEAQQEANDAVPTNDEALAAATATGEAHWDTVDTTGMSQEEIETRHDSFMEAYLDALSEGKSDSEALDEGNAAAADAWANSESNPNNNNTEETPTDE